MRWEEGTHGGDEEEAGYGNMVTYGMRSHEFGKSREMYF